MKAVKLPYAFNAQRLLAEVETIPDSYFRQIINPYVDEGDLFGFPLVELTQLEGESESKMMPKPVLEERPYLRSVLDELPGKIHTYRIHILKPGGVIREHRDTWKSPDWGVFRLHVPVVTDDKVETYLDGQRVILQPGECWFLDFDWPHQITNHGTQDRIHLIIDVHMDKQWQENLHEWGYRNEESGPYARMTTRDIHNMRAQIAEHQTEATQHILAELDSELQLRADR